MNQIQWELIKILGFYMGIFMVAGFMTIWIKKKILWYWLTPPRNRAKGYIYYN